MRHIVSRRASGKPGSLNRGKALKMAAASNTSNGVGVVAASSGNLGTTTAGGGIGNAPSSPVPDWTGDPVLLKEFAAKRKVPGFAKVVKGSYMTIGSSKFSLHRQHHEIYVHSIKMGVKVLAHCVKKVEVPGPRRGQTFTRLYSMDQRLTVPISYQGWFELLSEDGKSARPIASVPELARLSPQKCLVRENIKAYLSVGEGRLTFDKSKIIPAGEQLNLCGELALPAPSEGLKVKLLRCVDSKGDNVFLSFDQKGLFTPIAGENDFVGVFNIRDIVRRFRLPLTVKLAHGIRPRVPDSKFSGLVRLDWVYMEDTAFVCPLEKNHVRLLPVPCDVPLQLVAANNQEELCNSEMFRSIQAKCTRMVSNYNNTLHLIVSVPETVMRTQSRNNRASNIYSAALRQAGDDDTEQSARVRRSKSREHMLMDEIDHLYGYVRDGGTPPKIKFQYDSDEESYWEEPAYEPLDEFRSRLKALESGKQISFPSHYRPADLTQLKGLVGGNETPTAISPQPATTTAEGAAGQEEQGPDVTSESIYGVIGPVDGASAATVDEEPPPLPPRPVEMVSATVSTSSTLITSPTTVSTTTAGSATTTSTTTSVGSLQVSAASKKSPQSIHIFRRVSAPPLSLHQTLGRTASRQCQNEVAKYKIRSEEAAGDSQSASPRRVSRSDSEPSITISSSLHDSLSAARPLSSHRQQNKGEVKLDWKERLRRFDALRDKDKEGSSSTSSDSASGQQRAMQRLARDFKDSDLSSKTKAASGSPLGRGVKKRMQTLYL